MNPKICAVVATFNRRALLRECLDALLRQTRPATWVVVVDNACDDGTAEMLDQDYPSVQVVRLERNAGSSGGVSAGMKRALELGCDWVWVMDDDAEPAGDALEHLCGLTDRKDAAALACLKTDANGDTLYHHRGYFTLNDLPRRVIRPITEAQVSPGQPIEIDHASFVGLLVNRRAIDAVGFPDPRLFLQFDDVEYCIRLRSFGAVVLVPMSRIIHKEQVPEGIRLRRCFGLPYESIPYPHCWKRYFVYRNLVWLSWRYGPGKVKVICGLIALFGFLVVSTAVFETRRFRRICMFICAFCDGLRGRFDNARPWRVLYGQDRCVNQEPPGQGGSA